MYGGWSWGWDLFLSTPSARRATSGVYQTLPLSTDFYPRPPRGGRLWKAGQNWFCEFISIHALREEGDGISFPL